MALIEVTVSELQGAANRISKANESFRDAAVALKNAADELASIWKGTARDTFVEEQQEIDVWYKTMAECVDQYVVDLNKAADEYNRVDAEAAALIGKN